MDQIHYDLMTPLWGMTSLKTKVDKFTSTYFQTQERNKELFHKKLFEVIMSHLLMRLHFL